jgi:penicillin G amidase
MGVVAQLMINPSRWLPLFALAGTIACHPLSCCAPNDLPRDKPLVLASSDAGFPAANVDIVLDELGIPHISGQSEADVAYGLGFMHARDRLFQIFVYMHAGEGRLTELLGRDVLELDRENRLLMHRAQEVVDAFSVRQNALVNAYVAGINDGAAQVGQSAEMKVLGVEWEPMRPIDVMAVIRLQQWDQSVGFYDEMARHWARKAAHSDAQLAAFTPDMPSYDNPIVIAAEHSGDEFVAGPQAAMHAPPGNNSSVRNMIVGPSLRQGSLALAERFDLVGRALQSMRAAAAEVGTHGGMGHSNSWAVDGAHNSSGVPVLCNDPHLPHAAPGVFYLVHMETPEETIAGGSFPGIPGVLIGHGRDVAWGITNAYADVQDIVVLDTPQGRSDYYVVDNQARAFQKVEQRFKMGKEDGDAVVVEDFEVSLFGPVLPPGYGQLSFGFPLVDVGEKLALQWTALQFPLESGDLLPAFWDLAYAGTIDEVHDALQRFISPSMSFAIALREGTPDAGVHYRLGGLIPIRGDEQRVDVPRSGTHASAGFVGIVPSHQKPELSHPQKGFLVAANQRIVDNDVLSQRFVGFEGARPFRASKIRERLEAMLEAGSPTPAELLSIQQETTSLEAQQIAGALGRACPSSVAGHSDELVAAFCAAVTNFDGNFSVDSLGAMPFARLNRHVGEAIVLAQFGAAAGSLLVDSDFARMALHSAYIAVDADAATATTNVLFDDPATPVVENMAHWVAIGAKLALDKLVEEAGGSAEDWRWGKLHQLAFRGVLARAPVIGGLFQTGSHEESGFGTAPRAEGTDYNNKLRTTFGAGLRLFAVMGEVPEVRIVADLGQSGHFGHRHGEDQYPLWTKGEPVILARPLDEVRKTNDGLLTLTPR